MPSAIGVSCSRHMLFGVHCRQRLLGRGMNVVVVVMVISSKGTEQVVQQWKGMPDKVWPCADCSIRCAGCGLPALGLLATCLALTFCLQETVSSLKERACKAFSLETTKVDIWDFFQNSKHAKLENSMDRTLSDARILDEQTILLDDKVCSSGR